MDWLKVLKVGERYVDAGLLFGVPWVEYTEWVVPNRKMEVRIGVQVVLFEMRGKRILIDTGYQPGYNYYPNRLRKHLRALGILPRDIDLVLCSNIEADHIGGLMRSSRFGNIAPTFTRAKVFVPTTSRDPRANIPPLPQWEDLDEGAVFPGLEVEMVDGQAVIKIQVGGERVLYLGDLVPTHWHLPEGVMPQIHYNREAMAAKQRLLEEALDKGYLIVFTHGQQGMEMGYIEDCKVDGSRKVQFRPVVTKAEGGM